MPCCARTRKGQLGHVFVSDARGRVLCPRRAGRPVWERTMINGSRPWKRPASFSIVSPPELILLLTSRNRQSNPLFKGLSLILTQNDLRYDLRQPEATMEGSRLSAFAWFGIRA